VFGGAGQFAYAIEQVLERLATSDLRKADKARAEFAFLPSLIETSGGPTLNACLCEDAAFFALFGEIGVAVSCGRLRGRGRPRALNRWMPSADRMGFCNHEAELEQGIRQVAVAAAARRTMNECSAHPSRFGSTDLGTTRFSAIHWHMAARSAC